ncbi:NUDIX hydrolase [Candidatus Saccharibacteria bacterium]|nr:NUDIX hydrolase [Candidatus Saccharibacteria bacterium]MBQ6375592.1 NUDIX hydrolase [Candidatus Saccharibacteria bacterium]
MKEFFGSGDSAIRPDKPMTNREVVIALMEHPTEKKCLCVKNRKYGWIDFVMGGIEDGETTVEAAKREILEETGYSDLQSVEELPEVFYDNFFAAHKDVNRHITCHIVHGKLKSLAQAERSEKEKEIADVLWIDNEELPDKLSTEAHKYVLEQVLG